MHIQHTESGNRDAAKVSRPNTVQNFTTPAFSLRANGIKIMDDLINSSLTT